MAKILYRQTLAPVEPGAVSAGSAVKGSPLTLAEGDYNYKALNDDIQARAALSGATFTGAVQVGGQFTSGNANFTGTVAGLTKTMVGLANVDNTSDANKPVSTATQTALNAKQDTLVSGTSIKTVSGIQLLGTGDIPLDGKVTAPISSIDNTLPRFDGIAGNLLQGSGVIVDDNSSMAIGVSQATSLAGVTRLLHIENTNSAGFRTRSSTNGVSVETYSGLTSGCTGTSSNHPFSITTNNVTRSTWDTAGNLFTTGNIRQTAGSDEGTGFCRWSDGTIGYESAYYLQWNTGNNNARIGSMALTNAGNLLLGGSSITPLAGINRGMVIGKSTDAHSGVAMVSSAATWLTYNNGPMYWFVNGSNKMTLDTSGNLTALGAITCNGVLTYPQKPVVVASGTFTAAAGNTYVLVAVTALYLPVSPSVGNWVTVVNRSGTTNSGIYRNGQNIMGLAEDMILDNPNASLTLVFADATRGWVWA